MAPPPAGMGKYLISFTTIAGTALGVLHDHEPAPPDRARRNLPDHPSRPAPASPLRPDAAITQLLVYALAVSTRRYGIKVHALCAMSTHLHLVVTDTNGVLPRFLPVLPSHRRARHEGAPCVGRAGMGP